MRALQSNKKTRQQQQQMMDQYPHPQKHQHQQLDMKKQTKKNSMSVFQDKTVGAGVVICKFLIILPGCAQEAV